MTTTFIAVTIFFTFAFIVQFLMYRKLKRDLTHALHKLEIARLECQSVSWRQTHIKKDIEHLFMSRCNHAHRLEELENDTIRCNTDVIHGTLTVITRTPR